MQKDGANRSVSPIFFMISIQLTRRLTFLDDDIKNSCTAFTCNDAVAHFDLDQHLAFGNAISEFINTNAYQLINS